MRIRRFAGAAAAARALAADVARALDDRPSLVLGLPAGRTPVLLYRELRELARRGRADFSGATTFALDEFAGLLPDDPRTFRAFIRRALIDPVRLPARRAHFLDGTRPARPECAAYERAIAAAGGLDLLILGLGGNGHVGFNEPARALEAHTHPVTLTAATRRANAARFGGRTAAVPSRALTMGMATILQATRIVLLVTGAAKAGVVARTVHGRVTPRLPASFLQLHRDVEVWVDRAAGARLRVGGPG